MAITRINNFVAKAGLEQQLYEFLASVVSIVELCAGCRSCRLLRGAEDPSQLAIIEEWESIEAHKAAASAIPQEQLAKAMAMFAKPPTGMYYQA